MKIDHLKINKSNHAWESHKIEKVT